MGNQAEIYKMKQDMLFNMWKAQNKHVGKVFNFDGIVNPDIWFSEGNKKILFLLKEAYHDDSYEKENGLEYDLVQNLRENSIPSTTWKRVSEWTYGISNTTSQTIPSFIKLNADEQKKYLNQIAVINLKKSNGKAVSDDEDISEYVDSDANLLKIQIADIAPDIIICGNTFKWFKKVIGEEETRNIQELGMWVYKWNNSVVVDYYHPANQFPAVLNYYGLMGIYQKAIFNNVVVEEKENTIIDFDKEYDKVNVFLSVGEYQKANEQLNKIIENDINISKPWIMKAEIALMRGGNENLRNAIQYYKKAIEVKKTTEEEKEKIKAGINKYISIYMNALTTLFLGHVGFNLNERKEKYLIGIKQIEEDIKGLFEDSDQIDEYFHKLALQEIYEIKIMREQIKNRAKNNWKLFAIETNYNAFKKSLYLLTDLLIDAVDKCYDKEWVKKVEAYEKIIGWYDDNLYYAGNYPNRDSGVMVPIITLINWEKEAVKDKKQNFEALIEAVKCENDEEYAKEKEEKEKEWNKQVKVEIRSKYKR